MNQIPAILTPDMLSDILHIGRNTTYTLLRSNKIRSVRIGRQYRVSREALLEYLNRDTCENLPSVL